MKNNTSAVWKQRGTRQGLLRNALLKAMGYTPGAIMGKFVFYSGSAATIGSRSSESSTHGRRRTRGMCTSGSCRRR